MYRIILIALLSISFGCAHANLIDNGNFATGAPGSGCAAGITALPGWTVTNNVDIDSAVKPFPLCSGLFSPATYFIDLTGSFAPGQNDRGSISQTIATQAGKSYDLSFYFGGNPQWQYLGYPNDGAIKSMDVLLNGDVIGTYVVNTTIPPESLVTTHCTDSGLCECWFAPESPANDNSASFICNPSAGPVIDPFAGQFTQENIDFTATGSTTTLSFESLNGVGVTSPSDFGPLLADVSLKRLGRRVPEPASILLMLGGFGCLSLAIIRRRLI